MNFKLIKNFSQIGKEYDTLSKHSPKIPPPAPSARAYTSPLIDLFNNPATVAQNSQRINNSTGKIFSLISFKMPFKMF